MAESLLFLHQSHTLSSLSSSHLFFFMNLQMGFSIQRGVKLYVLPHFLVTPLSMIDLAGRPLSLKPFRAWGICFDEPGLFHP
jgi:hypothetical protein